MHKPSFGLHGGESFEVVKEDYDLSEGEEAGQAWKNPTADVLAPDTPAGDDDPTPSEQKPKAKKPKVRFESVVALSAMPLEQISFCSSRASIHSMPSPSAQKQSDVRKISSMDSAAGRVAAISELAQRFIASRKEEQATQFYAVAGAGMRTFGLGFLLVVISTMGATFIDPVIGQLGTALASWFLGIGFVTLSTIPVEAIDMETLLQRRRWILIRLCTGAMLCARGLFLTFAHPLVPVVHILQAPVGLALIFQATLALPLMVVWISLEMLAQALARTEIARRRMDNEYTLKAAPEKAWWFSALVLLSGSIFVIGRWVLQRRVHKRSGGRLGKSRNLAFYETIFATLAFLGFDQVTMGTIELYYLMHSEEDNEEAAMAERPAVAVASLIRGAGFAVPVAVMLIIGRRNLLQLSSRRFNRDPARAQRDGAFIAELLDSTAMEENQVWWIHRDEDNKDMRFDPFDQRYHWRLGRVASVEEEYFLVEVEKEPVAWGGDGTRNLDRTMATFATTCSRPLAPTFATDGSRRPSRRPSWLSISDSLEVSPALRGKSQWQSLKVLSRTFAGSQGKELPVEVHKIPMRSRNVPWQELMTYAQETLKCIEWHKTTRELMGSGAICGAAGEELAANEYYALSRPLRRGETIDFFMSHSWHDDAEAKYTQLELAADQHKKMTRREPTFWLDKVCIDQENIADGLRVLPVSVMACRRMLVLCGETYQTRLWCIWELFTLLAFTRMEQALEKLHIIPIDINPDSSNSIAKKLQLFDVQETHCYDPNEEARLREVIEALGEDRFNSRIQMLGHACDGTVEFMHQKAESGKVNLDATMAADLAMLGPEGVKRALLANINE